MAARRIKIRDCDILPNPAPKPSRRARAGAKEIAAILAMIGLFAGIFLSVKMTGAVFSDVETGEPTIVNLGTLDFVAATSTVPALIEIKPGEQSIHEISLQNTGNLDFQYKVGVQKISGDENVCEFLQLDASLNDAPVYSGGLINFSSGVIPYLVDSANWKLEISFPAGALPNIEQGRDCEFSFDFTAWQTDAANPGAGFFDYEKIGGKITILKNYPVVDVVYPNGGEQWFIVDDQCVNYEWCRRWCVSKGMNRQCEYEILWNAKTGGRNPNSALWVDIWYSVDSGQTWLAKIANHLSNTGKFRWRIPYDNRFISDKARVKAVAFDKHDESLWNWDQSDEDFCPPLLSIEDLMNQTVVIEYFPENASSTEESEPLIKAAPIENETIIDIVPMTIEEINRDMRAIAQNATTTADVKVGHEVEFE